MARGKLVFSTIIIALMRRHTWNFPGKRVLLDRFPRSVENASDFLELNGVTKLALHLDYDDTMLIECAMKQGKCWKADVIISCSSTVILEVESNSDLF